MHAPGTEVTRREMHAGRPWIEWPARVVVDRPDQVALWWPEGTPFAFVDDHPLGLHPWRELAGWTGEGVLELQRRADSYAVWHRWSGPERRFDGWYVNFQAPFRRNGMAFETADHEIDIVVHPDGSYEWKDVELLAERVREGRFSDEDAAAFMRDAQSVAAMLDRRTPWWDRSWATWKPNPAWT